MNELSIGRIAELTGGQLSGDPDVMITGANTLQNASRGEITFLSNPKYKKWIESTSASCVLIPSGLKLRIDIPVVTVENPDIAFALVLEHLYESMEHPFKGISPKASIDPGAELGVEVSAGDSAVVCAGAVIGDNTVVYPGAYIGPKVSIGSGCIIYPGVVIEHSVVIGNEVIIHSGAVIGSDGFGYTTTDGTHRKIPQVGSVIIGSSVEIGSNTTIDRGSPGNTEVGEGTKIDNLVQIAHNVRIGKNCFICAQVGIAGSTVIEDYAVLAGQAGIVGHITIGQGVKVGAQAGVTRDIKAGKLVSGYPASDHTQARKINALIRKLPKLFKEVERLSRIIDRDES